MVSTATNEYVTGPEILTETCLSSREKFYSPLNEEGISEEQYDRALEMWRSYDLKTLNDYLTLSDSRRDSVGGSFREL